jgi:hypothetical protein
LKGIDARGLRDNVFPYCHRACFRIHFRKSNECAAMPKPRKQALAAYRRRLKRQGVVRLEVHVRKSDAALVRGVVKALADPDREVEARAALREQFTRGAAKGLKALLAAAPLEGIELRRARDRGRDVDL